MHVPFRDIYLNVALFCTLLEYTFSFSWRLEIQYLSNFPSSSGAKNTYCSTPQNAFRQAWIHEAISKEATVELPHCPNWCKWLCNIAVIYLHPSYIQGLLKNDTRFPTLLSKPRHLSYLNLPLLNLCNRISKGRNRKLEEYKHSHLKRHGRCIPQYHATPDLRASNL